MGTRHLTAVVSNNSYHVAQYGQWDGYLEGQGKTIAKFLQSKPDLMQFRQQVEAIEVADYATDIKPLWTECGADPKSDMVTFDVSDRFKEKYPQFSRDTGAKVLELIYQGGITKLSHDLEFVADSLFCEWAYVLNLDTEIIEVYRGFNRYKFEPEGRFGDLVGDAPIYYPCIVVIEVPFDLFTVELIEELSQALEDEE